MKARDQFMKAYKIDNTNAPAALSYREGRPQEARDPLSRTQSSAEQAISGKTASPDEDKVCRRTKK